jgi:hypothetical protein
VQLTSDKPLKNIDFVKGADMSFPLIFAVTVESTKSGDH